MGQAIGPAIFAFFASTTVEVVIIRTILINIVLSGLTFEEDGVVYRAIA